MANKRYSIAIVFILSLAVLGTMHVLPATAVENSILHLFKQDGYADDEDFENLLKTASTAIADWPTDRKRLAEMLMERYGQPDQAAADSLTWLRCGPWKKTVVYRDPQRDRDGVVRPGALQQAADYRVARSRSPLLTQFDALVVVDPAAKEISFRSDSEETNFLVLNLADDVISGRKTPEQARDFASKTVAMSEAGKSSLYTTTLIFRSGDRSPESAQPFSPWGPLWNESR
jgi:hypothetical protein